MDNDIRPPQSPQPGTPPTSPESPVAEPAAAQPTAPVVGSEIAPSQPAPSPEQPLAQTPQPELPPAEPTPQPAPAKPVVGGRKSHKKLWLIILLVVVLLAGAAYAGWYFGHKNAQSTATKTPVTSTTTKPKTTTTAQGLQLDPNKNYGNKYANGVLPVGDGKYQTTGAKTGYVYACAGYAQNLKAASGGAGQRGPWFSSDGTTYDINKKLHVNGSVMWQASFTNTLSGSTRTIVTNDLPTHPTGTFPIAANDPAYAYDKNPNSIKGQTLTYALSADPTYSSVPNCMGGQSGIMLTGVALFNGFDAGGRDAGAWEVQDSCSGHPENEGIYHYHTLSSCIKDTSVKTVLGYALDGFPITGPQVAPNNILTTSDLDECHGITSSYTVDGKTFTGYHYVMTQDFPYSISCFRGTPITPPGQPQGPATRS